ncbi:MAG: hypothetical protein AB1778_01030 [Candidatus Bipolaricaulota bacterium]
MNASVVLSSAASKRLIARGVAAHPKVHQAMSEGRVVITRGTTNAFVAEELLGEPIDRAAFAAGFIDDRWNLNARFREMTDILLEKGRRIDAEPEAVVQRLQAGDVVIKGGNALDPWGTVGVLLASASGGTVGTYIPAAVARGADLVIPISVSKSVHASVADLSLEMGSGRTEPHQGLSCGLFPLHGWIVTEIEALDLLFGVESLHIASGGVGPGRGSVSLLLRGEAKPIQNALAAISAWHDEQDVELVGHA